MYKDLFHSTVFTKKTIPGISFIYKEFRGFLALKVLKMRIYYLTKKITPCQLKSCRHGVFFIDFFSLLRGYIMQLLFQYTAYSFTVVNFFQGIFTAAPWFMMSSTCISSG